jgi:hypothetical protein
MSPYFSTQKLHYLVGGTIIGKREKFVEYLQPQYMILLVVMVGANRSLIIL